MLIITCRHVVFDDTTAVIHLYLIYFYFNGTTYEGGDLGYVGSSKIFDVSIFRVQNRIQHGFQLSVADVYQFQKIYLACFPEATDVENVAIADPKMYHGIVSASESLFDVALADISPMPNSSGGAILSPSSHHILHGIHMGVLYHENAEFKLPAMEESMNEADASHAETFTLTTDDVQHKLPIVEAQEVYNGKTGQSDSPPANTRNRSLFAYDNVQFKKAVAYFVTSTVLLRLLIGGISLKRKGGYSQSK